MVSRVAKRTFVRGGVLSCPVQVTLELLADVACELLARFENPDNVEIMTQPTP